MKTSPTNDGTFSCVDTFLVAPINVHSMKSLETEKNFCSTEKYQIIDKSNNNNIYIL